MRQRRVDESPPYLQRVVTFPKVNTSIGIPVARGQIRRYKKRSMA